MMPTVAAVWDTYAARVLPKDAGPIQVQEIRRAFYAGAWGMFNLIKTTHELDDRQALDRIRALHKECDDFKQRVENGDA